MRPSAEVDRRTHTKPVLSLSTQPLECFKRCFKKRSPRYIRNPKVGRFVILQLASLQLAAFAFGCAELRMATVRVQHLRASHQGLAAKHLFCFASRVWLVRLAVGYVGLAWLRQVILKWASPSGRTKGVRTHPLSASLTVVQPENPSKAIKYVKPGATHQSP